jgi:hypothetical protein
MKNRIEALDAPTPLPVRVVASTVRTDVADWLDAIAEREETSRSAVIANILVRAKAAADVRNSGRPPQPGEAAL